MNTSRKDFVRVFHPSAEELYRNDPHFRPTTTRAVAGAISAGGVAAILVLAGFGFIHLVGLLAGWL